MFYTLLRINSITDTYQLCWSVSVLLHKTPTCNSLPSAQLHALCRYVEEKIREEGGGERTLTRSGSWDKNDKFTPFERLQHLFPLQMMYRKGESNPYIVDELALCYCGAGREWDAMQQEHCVTRLVLLHTDSYYKISLGGYKEHQHAAPAASSRIGAKWQDVDILNHLSLLYKW